MKTTWRLSMYASLTACLSLAAVAQLPPTFIVQPVSQSSAVGGTIQFGIAAVGSGTLTYQWRKNDVNQPNNAKFSGTATPTLTISSITTNEQANYTCRVSNSSGSVTSTVATLTVIVPPAITTHPKSVNTNAGATVSFTFAATGTPPLDYQWYRDAVSIPNATLNAYTLSGAAPEDSGIYNVRVSNAAGMAVSSNAVLRVGIAPTITGQPSGLTVTQGQTATFTVRADGTPLNYYWRKGSKHIAGATNATYSIPSAVGSDAGPYFVVVSNFLRQVTSSSANLTVIVPASITAQPESQTVGEGSNVTFAVTATGTAISYQWFKGETPLPGETGSTLTINNVQFSDEGAYHVTLSNVLTTVTSVAAFLTVERYRPTIVAQPLSQNMAVGGTATFAVEATGTLLSYQWFRNNMAIVDAITPQFSLTNLSFEDAGEYCVSVSNVLGGATSAVALLAVGYAPTILTQPRHTAAPLHNDAVLTVEADGTAPLYYQWFKDELPLAGQTNSTLALREITIADVAQYTAVVSNCFGVAATVPAILTVQLPPEIVQQPSGAFCPVGGAVTLTVIAIGTQPITCQWRKDNLDIAGANATDLCLNNISLMDAGLYSVLLSSPFGSVTSTSAAVGVGFPPTIVTPPSSLVITQGGSAQLTCLVTGTPPICLQWIHNGTPLLEQTAPSILFTNIRGTNFGHYLVFATNNYGSTTSAVAELRNLRTRLWKSTGSLNVPRYDHTATLLPNRQVYVAGGSGADQHPLSSAELYNPVSETWSMTGSLEVPRRFHTATLLTDGCVLLVGGQAVSVAEVYDPTAGSCAQTGAPEAPDRERATATLLQNGLVLLAGGFNGEYPNYPEYAELYDPTMRSWSRTGALKWPRNCHTATLLPNGKVLLAGGFNRNTSDPAMMHAELYDPETGIWSAVNDFAVGRTDHTSTLLGEGTVLIVGGITSRGSVLSSTELFDYVTGTWSLSGSLSVPRGVHTATRLPDGEVLVVSWNHVSEVYSPLDGMWTPTSPASIRRSHHTATLLLDGRVLICGGLGETEVLAAAALYDKAFAILTLTNLTQVFDGTARHVMAVTMPPDLTVLLTYDGSTNAPVGTGSYAVVATVDDLTYQGSVTNTLAILPAAASIIVESVTVHPDGSFELAFSSVPGAVFTVLSSSDVASPLRDWEVLGSAVETPPGSGQFNFVHSQAFADPQRFYRIRSP